MVDRAVLKCDYGIGGAEADPVIRHPKGGLEEYGMFG